MVNEKQEKEGFFKRVGKSFGMGLSAEERTERHKDRMESQRQRTEMLEGRLKERTVKRKLTEERGKISKARQQAMPQLPDMFGDSPMMPSPHKKKGKRKIVLEL